MKRNVKKNPFIEVNGKKYFTVDHLATLHDVSSWTIKKRIDQYNIAGISAFGEMLYLDDVRYDKVDRTDNSKNFEKTKVSSYAGLFLMVKDMNTKLDLILEHLTANQTAETNGEHNNGKDETP